jgi:Tfp pilus assembly protein PilF
MANRKQKRKKKRKSTGRGPGGHPRRTSQQSGQVADTLNLALQHHQAGQLDQAEQIYRQVLSVDPDNVIANHYLGVIALQVGKNDIAVQLIGRALSVQPDYADAHNNLGNALNNLGRLEEAVTSFEKAVCLKPDYVDAYYNLGISLKNMGRLTEAATSYQKALAINPDYAKAHHNLGNVFKDLGQPDEALACFLKALSIELDFPLAFQGVASLVKGKRIQENETSAHLKNIVNACLLRDDIEHQDLVNAALSFVFDQERERAVRGYLDSSEEASLSFLEDKHLRDLLQDPHFLLLLKKTVVADRLAEIFLTRLRRAILLHVASGAPEEETLNGIRTFIYGLALQCFWNEYVFYQSPEEKKALDNLLLQTREKIINSAPTAQLYIGLLACYSPLITHDFVVAYSEDSGRINQKDFSELLNIQVRQHLREKEIAAYIPSLVDIQDNVSRNVQQQYEENPYPRWVGIYRITPLPFLEFLHKNIYPNILAEPLPMDKPEVLIAGGGKGHQPISSALAYAGSSVLAVDLSRTSLAYAKRKAGELGVPNIEFLQANILDLAKLGRCFDIIECTGGIASHG